MQKYVFFVSLQKEEFTMKRIGAVLMAAVTAAVMTNGVCEELWQSYGSADFTDGWIMPYFGKTGIEERTWRVDVEKRADAEIYRLVDPYHSAGFRAMFGEAPNTGEAHDIVIDCTDNSYVRVEYQLLFEFAAGYPDMGGECVWGQSRAAFLEEIGKSRTTITAAGLNCTREGNLITVRECFIGFSPYASEGGKMWNSGVADAMVRLIPASVDATMADEIKNEEEEYFNLQGLRVSAPEKGGLYIVKCGGKAEKRVVR